MHIGWVGLREAEPERVALWSKLSASTGPGFDLHKAHDRRIPGNTDIDVRGVELDVGDAGDGQTSMIRTFCSTTIMLDGRSAFSKSGAAWHYQEPGHQRAGRLDSSQTM